MNIDRELQAALDVDPSPEFVARVRMRIASEPPPRRWGFAWMVVAAGAAAAVVVAVVVTRAVGERKGSAELLASRVLPTVMALIDPGSPKGLRYDDHAADATGVTQSSRIASATAVAQPSRAASAAVVAQPFRAAKEPESSRAASAAVVAQPFRAAKEPEILVDSREAAAFRRLLAGVSAGRIDLNHMLKPSPFVMADIAPVEDIDITPLSIEPLSPGGEGARP